MPENDTKDDAVRRATQVASIGDYVAGQALIAPYLDELLSARDLYTAALCSTYGKLNADLADRLFAQALEQGADPFWTRYHRGNLFLLAGRVHDAALTFASAGEFVQGSEVLHQALVETLDGLRCSLDSNKDLQALKLILPLIIKYLTKILETKKARCRVPKLYNCKLTYDFGPMPSFEDLARLNEDSVSSFKPIGLGCSVFVNTVPKSGTHIFQSIFRHLYHSQCHEKFVTIDDDMESTPQIPTLIIGHLPYCAKTVIETRLYRRIQVMRDPCELLLSLARSAYDTRSTRPDHIFIRKHLTPLEYLPMLVMGHNTEGIRTKPFTQFLDEFLISWVPSSDLLLDFSEVIEITQNPDSKFSEFCMGLVFECCCSEPPVDWRERVRAAGGPKISASFLPAFPYAEGARALRAARELLEARSASVLAWYDGKRRASADRRRV